jgi:hypothetical protein
MDGQSEPVRFGFADKRNIHAAIEAVPCRLPVHSEWNEEIVTHPHV